MSSAGNVGTQILDAWPELHKIGKLRRDTAHGRGRPSADFGIRCRGGAMALQWIQRLRLLTEIGIRETMLTRSSQTTISTHGTSRPCRTGTIR